jgi:hypothetical protein
MLLAGIILLSLPVLGFVLAIYGFARSVGLIAPPLERSVTPDRMGYIVARRSLAGLLAGSAFWLATAVFAGGLVTIEGIEPLERVAAFHVRRMLDRRVLIFDGTGIRIRSWRDDVIPWSAIFAIQRRHRRGRDWLVVKVDRAKCRFNSLLFRHTGADHLVIMTAETDMPFSQLVDVMRGFRPDLPISQPQS